MASSTDNRKSPKPSERSRLLQQLRGLRGPEETVEVIARSLPHVAPNVLLGQRDELVPLIVVGVFGHGSAEVRESLLGLLFNLIKKPDPDQRRVIVEGCVTFARFAGSVRTEAELLPQCWEQIGNKYVERRLLVLDVCCSLCPYLHPDVLSSLVLSILQQMLADEKVEAVKETAVRGLAVLCLYIEDADKFLQVSDLVLRSVIDPLEQAASRGRTVLLPAFALWAVELGRFEDDVMAVLVNRIVQMLQLTSINQSSNEVQFCAWFSALKAVSGICAWRAISTGPYLTPGVEVDSGCDKTGISAPSTALPELDSESFDNPRLACPSLEKFDQTYAAFLRYTSPEWFEPWPVYEQLMKGPLEDLIGALAKLAPNLPRAVEGAVDFFRQLCAFLGPGVTSYIANVFERVLKGDKHQLTPKDDFGTLPAGRAILPVYVVGVLRHVQPNGPKRVVKYLRQALQDFVPMTGQKTSLISCFKLLIQHDPDHRFALMDIIWELVVHTHSSAMRRFAAVLLQAVVPFLDDQLLATRLVPGLVTLSSDEDLSVRCESAIGFGAVLLRVPPKEVEEKVRVQIGTLLDEAEASGQLALQQAIMTMFIHVAPVVAPGFREEFLLPRLAIAVAQNQVHSVPQEHRVVMHALLYDAYSALACCYLSPAAIAEAFLPGLRALQKDLPPERAKVAASILRDFESKLDGAARERSYSLHLTGQDVQAGVEVVRARMMDRFKDLKGNMDAGNMLRAWKK